MGETFFDKMRRDCTALAGELWHKIVSFYEEILGGDYEYIIFVTRRCYVMYVIIALCEGWEFDKRVIMDFGIYARKGELADSRRVIVVDDIAMRGYTISNVVNEVAEISGRNTTIYAKLYALCNDVPQQMRIINGRGLERKVTMTHRDAYLLSLKLIQIIETSGIPYTTYIYPSIRQVKSKDVQAVFSHDVRDNPEGMEEIIEEDLLERYKWNMECIEENLKDSVLGTVGYYGCRRIYARCENMRGDNRPEVEVPFIFLYDLKREYAETYYRALASACMNLGDWIAKPFLDGVDSAKCDGGKSYRYLRCLETLLFSRMITVNKLKEQEIEEKIAVYSLKGAFSDDIIGGLKCGLNKAAIHGFLQDFEDKLSKCVGGDIEKVFSKKSERVETYTDVILANEDLNLFETAFEEQKNIFWKIRMKNKGGKDELPQIGFMPLLKKLQSRGKAWKDDIFSGAIKCWDMGIATYKYGVSQKVIYAYCGVGEMSALRLQVVFGEALGRYYTSLRKGANKRSANTAEELWAIVVKGNKKSVSLKSDFIEWYEKNRGNMYQYAIFE